MIRKTTKKLSLGKDTLAGLSRPQLDGVAGGASVPYTNCAGSMCACPTKYIQCGNTSAFNCTETETCP
jgi:hypothetical protein